MLLLAGLSVALFVAQDALAQGLSGPPQRLEETLSGKNGPASGSGGSSSRPPAQGSSQGYDEAQAMEESMRDDMEASYDEYDEMDDMYDESDYGDGGYGGSMRSRGRGRGVAGSSDAMLLYGLNPASTMEDIDLAALLAPREDPIQTGPVLKRESEQAFASGNYPLALELAFGHMAAEYPDSVVDLRTVKYSSTLRRPVWNVRFGVSMSVRGASSLKDAKPIRETSRGRSIGRGEDNNNRRRGRGGPGPGPQDEMDEYGGAEDYGSSMEMEDDMSEMDEYDSGYEDSFGGGAGGPPSRRSRDRDEGPKRQMLDPAVKEETRQDHRAGS